MEKKELIEFLTDEGYLKTNKVIEAFKKVPREKFILPQYAKHAYVNEPLPIPAGQTISQPLTVAVMTEALSPKKGMAILEVGSGSGYQAAILSEIVGTNGKIATTEIIPELFEFARKNLQGYKNVEVINADGSAGYTGKYDRIIVTASAPSIPEPLLENLKDGGKMIIPVGNEMLLIEKSGDAIRKKFLGYFAFVPLTGEHGQRFRDS